MSLRSLEIRNINFPQNIHHAIEKFVECILALTEKSLAYTHNIFCLLQTKTSQDDEFGTSHSVRF